MKIRNTTFNDINIIMDIYEGARQFMRNNGNMQQWTNGYPGIDVVKSDFLSRNSYVCTEEDQIQGVFFFKEGIDPTYVKIYHGKWLNDKPYGVVHRIASRTNKKGVASYCLDWCLEKCKNIKIDTHRDNVPMQKMLEKNGFAQCGIIYLEDGSERLAYQKSII